MSVRPVPLVHEVPPDPADGAASPPVLTRPSEGSTVFGADVTSDNERSPGTSAVERVRDLAERGTLADHARSASAAEYSWLFGGGYEICWPIVFEGLTRGLERSRGHHDCARGVAHLEPECLDRYQDDVEAVIEDLLRSAKVPIHNLEGWIRSRLVKATIDGHRRRRGKSGALQRPRMPVWLARLLGDDKWLCLLAVDIQTWVGVAAAAGCGLWPYGVWAERRTAATGDLDSTEQDVARDVETVLAAMRRNVAWYERCIEGPLGCKQASLVTADSNEADHAPEPRYLALTERYESDEALLTETATFAIDTIAVRIGRGENPHQVVKDVIDVLFGSGTGVEDIDRLPGSTPYADEAARRLLVDSAALDRLVRQVCDILASPDA